MHPLGEAARILGWDVICIENGWRIPYDEMTTQAGVVYGEPLFCEVIAQQMNWRLHSNSRDWLVKLPEKYVKRNIYLTTLKEARKISEKKFIKSADDAIFPAKSYNDGSTLPKQDILDDVSVIVSDKIKFMSEYRCFIKDRKVVSICCYSITNAVYSKENWYVATDSIIKFTNDMLSDETIECAPGCAIDIGRINGHEMAVINSNPAFTSDLYGCEIVGSFDAIRSSCTMV